MKEFEHLRLQFKSIKHATNNFDEGNFIAEGGFGKVYRGEFYSEVLGAVKCIDRSKDQADASFWREIMMLSTYKHKNLISLIGFCDEGESRILVYEYAHNKSLDFYLHDPNLRWIQRLRICLGAAYGLEHLHNPRGSQQRVLHRDIKSANILLDKDWNAKVADFGLSKYGPANQQHTFLFSDAKGTLGYCDPMYIETMLLTKESDVYSFGVVLFEVLCSRPCVDMRYNDQRRSLPLLVKNCEQEQQKLHAIIGFNLMEQIDEYAFDTFVTLAYQCLQRDRSRRPTMELVVRKLESALEYQEAEKKFAWPNLSAVGAPVATPSSTVVTYEKLISSILEFSTFGQLLKSSAPVELTDAETENPEYTVNVVKHIYKKHLVFQFNCTNTTPKLLLENVAVIVDASEAEEFAEVATKPLKALPYDTSGQTFVAFEKPEDVPATGRFSNALKFLFKMVEPSTGEAEEDGVEDECRLEDFEIVATDYMLKVGVSNFRNAWESISPNFERVDEYDLGLRGNLNDVVSEVITLLGMQPCEGTEVVMANSISHSCLLSGVSIGNVKVLVRLSFWVDSYSKEVTLKLVVRSEDESVSDALHDAIADY